MAIPDNGGAAFPQIKSHITAFDLEGIPLGSGITGFDCGMTLRQWYAGQALAGGLANGDYMQNRDMADDAFSIADAMIEVERNERERLTPEKKDD